MHVSATQKGRKVQAKTVSLNLRVSAEERALISAMARDEGLPMATFIMWLMRREAKARGLQPPKVDD